MKTAKLFVAATLITISIVFAFLLSQDALARLALQKYNRSDIALWLVRRDADLAMLLGNYYFGQTLGKSEYDLGKAEKAFQKALLAKPGILWGHYQLARVYFMQGKFNEALEQINLELAASPANLRSLYVRGLIYGYRGLPGDLQKAEDDFSRFTLWAQKEWAGYNDLAWILSKQGKHEEAKEAVLTALQQIPDAKDNPWILNSLGVAELNLKEYSQAAESFEKALALAEKLNIADWRRAYPGNNPAYAEAGLREFLDAIESNLQRAKSGLPSKAG